MPKDLPKTRRLCQQTSAIVMQLKFHVFSTVANRVRDAPPGSLSRRIKVHAVANAERSQKMLCGFVMVLDKAECWHRAKEQLVGGHLCRECASSIQPGPSSELERPLSRTIHASVCYAEHERVKCKERSGRPHRTLFFHAWAAQAYPLHTQERGASGADRCLCLYFEGACHGPKMERYTSGRFWRDVSAPNEQVHVWWGLRCSLPQLTLAQCAWMLRPVQVRLQRRLWSLGPAVMCCCDYVGLRNGMLLSCTLSMQLFLRRLPLLFLLLMQAYVSRTEYPEWAIP